ncbi:hypothetical protein BDDG_13105 [Blastomyces dermatitidis ATCC 18188]|uniref:Uncharacterized protein n=1 Tax=Ajellomyces dermatitidis (strain ATCC 18188 / CBS 674.68) TaxID=653446 RepID=A0A0J9HI91_AJEDA|nr:hypothetical protein BDDG_13105 [Blastomyces dermatitidis ATCC 18188]
MSPVPRRLQRRPILAPFQAHISAPINQQPYNLRVPLQRCRLQRTAKLIPARIRVRVMPEQQANDFRMPLETCSLERVVEEEALGAVWVYTASEEMADDVRMALCCCGAEGGNEMVCVGRGGRVVKAVVVVGQDGYDDVGAAADGGCFKDEGEGKWVAGWARGKEELENSVVAERDGGLKGYDIGLRGKMAGARLEEFAHSGNVAAFDGGEEGSFS